MVMVNLKLVSISGHTYIYYKKRFKTLFSSFAETPNGWRVVIAFSRTGTALLGRFKVENNISSLG